MYHVTKPQYSNKQASVSFFVGHGPPNVNHFGLNGAVLFLGAGLLHSIFETPNLGTFGSAVGFFVALGYTHSYPNLGYLNT